MASCLPIAVPPKFSKPDFASGGGLLSRMTGNGVGRISILISATNGSHDILEITRRGFSLVTLLLWFPVADHNFLEPFQPLLVLLIAFKYYTGSL
jgi:hypothetical protein